MSRPVFVDHIEVHVSDVPQYCSFLEKLFLGGRFKQISENGTFMFTSDDTHHIEVKKKSTDAGPTESGFCNPCLRMENSKSHIEKNLGLKIEKTVNNPDGPCYFFKDPEGITWHIKDYLVKDKYVNW